MSQQHTDQQWMEHALTLARQGEACGEVPVGALVVREGQVLGEGFNRPITSIDATAHAEIVALRAAAAVAGNYRLPGATLYVTIEPCTMCVGAMIHARIERLVFGALESRAGAVVSRLQLLDAGHYNHRVAWEGGVLADACGKLISEFFREKRRR